MTLPLDGAPAELRRRARGAPPARTRSSAGAHAELRRRWAAGDATEEERDRCARLDEASAVAPPVAPDTPGTPFFHGRRLGDTRPAAAGLPVCRRYECRRHFTPTQAGQDLCQRCLDDEPKAAPKEASGRSSKEQRRDASPIALVRKVAAP